MVTFLLGIRVEGDDVPSQNSHLRRTVMGSRTKDRLGVTSPLLTSASHVVFPIGLCFSIVSWPRSAAMGEDSLALQMLSLSEALPANHPDSSLVWCCLSRALWRCGELELAARSAQESFVLREEILGSAAAETAVARNNLACCFMDLYRPGEALAHLRPQFLQSPSGTSIRDRSPHRAADGREFRFRLFFIST